MGEEVSYTFIIVIVPKHKPSFLEKRYHDWSSHFIVSGDAMKPHPTKQVLRRWIERHENWHQFLLYSLHASKISSQLSVSFMLVFSFPTLHVYPSSHSPSMQSFTSIFTLDCAGTRTFLGAPLQPSIFHFSFEVLPNFHWLLTAPVAGQTFPVEIAISPPPSGPQAEERGWDALSFPLPFPDLLDSLCSSTNLPLEGPCDPVMHSLPILSIIFYLQLIHSFSRYLLNAYYMPGA